MKRRKYFWCGLIILFLASCKTIPASQTLNELDASLDGISQDAKKVETQNLEVIQDLKSLENLSEVKPITQEMISPITVKAQNTQNQIEQLQADLKTAKALTVKATAKVSETEFDLVEQKKANGVLWRWVIVLGGLALIGVGLFLWKIIKR